MPAADANVVRQQYKLCKRDPLQGPLLVVPYATTTTTGTKRTSATPTTRRTLTTTKSKTNRKKTKTKLPHPPIKTTRNTWAHLAHWKETKKTNLVSIQPTSQADALLTGSAAEERASLVHEKDSITTSSSTYRPFLPPVMFKMRSRKVQVMVISFLIMWTFITYYVLLRNGSSQLSSKQLQQLRRLVPEATKEQQNSLLLTRKLIEFLKLKYGSDSPTTTTPKISIIAAEISNEVQQIDAIAKATPESLAKSTPAQIPTQTHLSNGEPVIPILVFACNRLSVVRCLENLVQYRPNAEQFPIIVSQVSVSWESIDQPY